MNTAVTTVLGQPLTVSGDRFQTHHTGLALAEGGEKGAIAQAKKLAAAMFPGEKLVWKRRGFASPSAKLADGRLVYAAAIHPQMGELSFSYRTEAGWIPEVSVEVAS